METPPEDRIILADSRELFFKSLELAWHHPSQIAVLSLLPTTLLPIAVTLLPNRLGLGLLIYAVSLLWAGINAPALYYFAVKASRGQDPGIIEAYQKGFHFFWRYIEYSFLNSLIILAGSLLFIIPGLIFTRRYILTGFYIIDQDMGVQEAMRMSSEQTKPVAGYIWGTLGVSLLVFFVIWAISQAFAHTPWLSAIVTSLLSVSLLFMLPLRYVDVVENVAPTTKKSSR